MSGSLRFLYENIVNCERTDVWTTVFKHQWAKFKQVQVYYHDVKCRKCQKWPDITDEESWNLYSVSRVSDIMLLRFQEGNADNSPYRDPDISLDHYTEFFTHIGFTEQSVRNYHPFYCEVVEVINEDVADIELVELKWPAFMLGNMLFSRAGAVVKAPRQQLVKGIADSSCLYWSFWRKYRETTDLSMGWGHNSQWGTSFRRDFDLGDRYAFNVDGCNERVDLQFPLKNTDDRMGGMQRESRIEFLRNRCTTTCAIDDGDLWPFDDYFEEKKS